MRKLLIVSPKFPPISSPDMQRVRTSLPHFAEFGWRPLVLAVEPEMAETLSEPELMRSVPEEVPVRRVRALPARWTRKLGVGDIGLRALPFLHRAGMEMIAGHEVDLVYFSTTVFPVMCLGRVWKRRRGVPFVIDFQDPWVGTYRQHPCAFRNRLKYLAARRIHRVLERWTMREVDGLIAVSSAYLERLRARYPWLAARPQRTLTFGASARDFDIVRTTPYRNRFFQPGNGCLHGVYVGRGGFDLAPALRIAFRALERGLRERPELFSRVRLHFVGTDYAPPELARPTVRPVAEEFGLGDRVVEHPPRVPYFEALGLLLDADFLLVPGSEDAQYTASKIFPYILARKPMVAVFHEESSVVGILGSTRAGAVIAFRPGEPPDAYAGAFYDAWERLLERLPFVPPTDFDAFTPYTARETTRRQCELFDLVAAGR